MYKKILWTILVVGIFYSFSYADTCREASGYSCEQIVDAIYIAEGGEKTRYPFGIMSVKCTGYTECRHVCMNTVVNNVVRWRNSGNSQDYLTFLGCRYAPLNAHPLNKYWKNNVETILRRNYGK